MSKTAFAIDVGISRERLFNYEAGRTPIPWRIGSYVCNVYNVNPLWLATGEGLPFVRFGWGDTEGNHLGKPANFRFSDGVTLMQEETKQYLRSGQTNEVPRAVYRHKSGDFVEAVSDMAGKWMAQLPPDAYVEFFDQLRRLGDDLAAELTRPRTPQLRLKAPPRKD